MSNNEDYISIYEDKSYSSIRDYLSKSIYKKVKEKIKLEGYEDIIIVCIGTDKEVGDSFGPMVGSKLFKSNINYFNVYGTMENPLHSLNIESFYNRYKEKIKNSLVISVDAMVSNKGSYEVGTIAVYDDGFYPGAALKRGIAKIGNIGIGGIVFRLTNNYWKSTKYINSILHNFDSETLKKMASITSDSLCLALLSIYKELLSKEEKNLPHIVKLLESENAMLKEENERLRQYKELSSTFAQKVYSLEKKE